MDNKTKIKFIKTSVRYKAGETGYVDGYVIGTNNTACAIVIKDNDNKFVLANINNIIKI